MDLTGNAHGRFVRPQLMTGVSNVVIYDPLTQVWPLTPAWGALSGYILGSLWALLVTDLKEIVELGITARRDDEQARPSGKKAKQKNT